MTARPAEPSTFKQHLQKSGKKGFLKNKTSHVDMRNTCRPSRMRSSKKSTQPAPAQVGLREHSADFVLRGNDHVKRAVNQRYSSGGRSGSSGSAYEDLKKEHDGLQQLQKNMDSVRPISPYAPQNKY